MMLTKSTFVLSLYDIEDTDANQVAQRDQAIQVVLENWSNVVSLTKGHSVVQNEILRIPDVDYGSAAARIVAEFKTLGHIRKGFMEIVCIY